MPLRVSPCSISNSIANRFDCNDSSDCRYTLVNYIGNLERYSLRVKSENEWIGSA